MSNPQADQPHSRLPRMNGGNPKLTIIRLALTAQDVTVIEHTLRQTIEATRLVMTQPWPPKVKAQRQSEMEAMEKALTTLVEQKMIGGG